MERDNAEMRQSLEKAQVLHNQVQGMFDEGLLAQDPDGTYRAVRDEAESECIRSQVSMTKRKHAMTPAEA